LISQGRDTMFGLTAYKEIITGQLLLSAGALFYTGWWLAAFKPDSARSGGALAALLFFLLAAFGLSGTALTVHGVHGLPLPASWPGGGMLFIMALLVYFILLTGSVKLFGRKPTTELILMVLWALMEIMALGVLHEAGGLAGTAYGLTWAAVIAASLIAFAAYMVYYRMDDDTAYITGAIPLLVDGAVTLLIAFCGR